MKQTTFIMVILFLLVPCRTVQLLHVSFRPSTRHLHKHTLSYVETFLATFWWCSAVSSFSGQVFTPSLVRVLHLRIRGSKRCLPLIMHHITTGMHRQAIFWFCRRLNTLLVGLDSLLLDNVSRLWNCLRQACPDRFTPFVHVLCQFPGGCFLLGSTLGDVLIMNILSVSFCSILVFKRIDLWLQPFNFSLRERKEHAIYILNKEAMRITWIIHNKEVGNGAQK